MMVVVILRELNPAGALLDACIVGGKQRRRIANRFWTARKSSSQKQSPIEVMAVMMAIETTAATRTYSEMVAPDEFSRSAPRFDMRYLPAFRALASSSYRPIVNIPSPNLKGDGHSSNNGVSFS